MNNSNVQTIDVETLQKAWENNPDLCVIDVREVDEWEALRIPGAQLIPKDKITTQIQTITKDFTKPLYLHCRGGVRSLHAAQALADMGYKEVYSIDGGIMAWEACGFPVEKGA